MQRKILFISEALDVPFDEGIKNIVASLYKQLETRSNVFLVTKKGNKTGGIKVIKTDLNRLFLSTNLKFLLKKYAPDVVLYIPFASCSFNSFIRAKVLKMMRNNIKVVLLCVQHREYSSAQSSIIAKFLKPDLVLLLGKMDESFFLNKNIKVKVLPPAVDTVKFCPATIEEKRAIRAEYKIPDDKTIILHVGHIKAERNIGCLLEIQKIDNVQVVVVGSTTTVVENALKDKLEKEGIRMIDEFIADISKVYKMSDIYVFPVIENTAAIDMPLSVFEAMACNLSVITTRFGGLVNFFKEGEGFRYFDNTDELVKLVKNIDVAKISNTKKIEGFTWDRFTDEIIKACDELS